MHRNQPREVKKKEETEKLFSQKGTRENSKKKPTKNLNEMEISDLPDKEFKTMVIKMLSEIRTIHEQTENFNKEVENIKYKTKIVEMNNNRAKKIQ